MSGEEWRPENSDSPCLESPEGLSTTEDDPPISRTRHGIWALALLALCPMLLRTVRDIHDLDDPLSDAGLLMIMAGVLVVFAALRGLIAAFCVRVTRTQAKERDLWRGDRILVFGIALLFLPIVIGHYLLGFEKAQSTTVLTVATALFVVGPVTVWARNDGVWPLFKEHISTKLATKESSDPEDKDRGVYFPIEEAAEHAEQRGISRAEFDEAVHTRELPTSEPEPGQIMITEEALQVWFDSR